MATERTPQYKRVKRAEEGRDSWKIKAFERREEVQKLALELARKEERLAKQAAEIKELKKTVASSDNEIAKLKDEIVEFKKKA